MNEAAEDFRNTRRRFDKPLKTELRYRAAALMLAMVCIIASSVCLYMLTSPSVTMDRDSINLKKEKEDMYDSLIEELQMSQTVSHTRKTAGWILFLSLAVFFYQSFASIQLFVFLKLLYMKIPVGKSLWYLFPLIDLIVSILCIVGYLSAAIALAVCCDKWIESIDRIYLKTDTYDTAYILSYVFPTVFTCFFAFLFVFFFIGIIGYIFMAKIQCKWPNYYVPEN